MSRYANNPETLDKRRRTVRADNPAPSATTRSPRPSEPVRCAVMNRNTSAQVTSAGGRQTTRKNTARS
jgi:hypothetical protein